MCGIAGYLSLDGRPAHARFVEPMIERIRHRGPDGEGVVVDGPAGLGHCRLSIIDTSSRAAQPMTSPDGRFCLVYNGEIYNFRELRAELARRGCMFRTTSDTEVLLAALCAWGRDAVPRFNGMFAFALWDSRERRLLLARDRYGIKPLYYAFLHGTVVFASEAKAVLVFPGLSPELDCEALLEYFTFQNLFTERTLLKNVKLLPAGCLAEISPGDECLQVRRYWDFDFRKPDHRQDDGEYEEELDRLFRQAVRRQLVSDVEVGSYLSGGIDSGAITAVASRELPGLKTFTCGFDLHSVSGLELSFDEREKAEHLSHLFGTEHYEAVLKAGDMQRVMDRLVWHLDELRVGQCYPNYYAAKLASRFVKVVLCGTGGDEMFGGYPWRYYRAVVNDSFDEYADKYYLFWQRLVPNKVIWEMFSPVKKDVARVWTRDIFAQVFARRDLDLGTPEDYVNHSLYFEGKTFLAGLLHVEDKLSMAHGLEARVPFLDNDLVDFAMGLPVHLKLGNLREVVLINENEPVSKPDLYYRKTRDGKLLLRRVLSHYVPNHMCEGVKQGFSGPDATWFRGESIRFVRQTLFNPSALLYNFLDRKTTHRLVTEHLEGKVNRRLLIWSLLCFESWCRLFLLGAEPVDRGESLPHQRTTFPGEESLDYLWASRKTAGIRSLQRW